jgi:C-terminal processing protease CtpA/Prc
MDWLSDDGFKIAEVHEGYSAESAGLRVGDVILLIDGSKPYDNSNDIRGEEPKDMVLTIKRDGKIFEVKISRCKVYY